MTPEGNHNRGFHKWVGSPKMDGLQWTILLMDDLGVPPYQEPYISIHFAVLVTATSNAFQRSNIAAPLARAEGCCTFGSTSPILTGQTRMAWIWEFDQWPFQEPNPQAHPQVLTRYKAYFSGLCKGIFTKNVALYGTVPPI